MSDFPVPEGYRTLSAAEAADYAAGHPALAARLGGAPLAAEEVGDGNLNLVFVVRGPAGALVLKQALPYIRSIGPDWPFPLSRMRYEHAALVEEGRAAPGLVPEILAYDETLALVAMEHLGRHEIWRKGLVGGRTYPQAPAALGCFLARTLFATSALGRPARERAELIALFAGNAELAATTAEVVFAGPYWEARYNRHTCPQLDRLAGRLRADGPLKAAAAELQLRFLSAGEALIHGDLHTGSVMVAPDDTRVIDPEFCLIGPMGFDVGALLGNLWLAYFSQPGHGRSAEGAFAEGILAAVEEVWRAFAETFETLWRERPSPELFPPAAFRGEEAALADLRRRRLAEILTDSLGFAGAKMTRRLIGISHVEDFEAIADPEARAACEARALVFARRLILERAAFGDLSQISALARRIAAEPANLSGDAAPV